MVAQGPETQRFSLGERIGIPWFRHACGVCKFCRSGHENLCPHSVYTGWDHDGGYAEYVTVPEGFAYRIPEKFDSLEAAPLLCAGIIGYRAFERANVPAGGRLGLYGFGGSAHITAQIAMAQGIEVHVFTRGPTPGNLPFSWAVPRLTVPMTSPTCRWTPRSSLPQSATSCCRRWPA